MPVSTGTLLSTGSGTASTSTIRTAVFTATANQLLLAMVGNGGNNATSGGALTVSDSFTGAVGAWTTIQSLTSSFTASSTMRASVFWATVGGVGATGTIMFVTGLAAESRYNWMIISVDGHNTSSPIGSSLSTVNTLTTATLILGAVEAGNRAFSWLETRGSTSVTSGANEREIGEVVTDGAFPWRGQAQDGTESTLDVSGISATSNLFIALEVQAPAAGTTWLLERVERHYPRGFARGYMRGEL